MSAVAVQPWSSTSVGAPAGPGTSRSSTRPDGSDTVRVAGSTGPPVTACPDRVYAVMRLRSDRFDLENLDPQRAVRRVVRHPVAGTSADQGGAQRGGGTDDVE